MDSQVKMKFPAMCKELRDANHLKQREVANAVRLKLSSYGNVESNNHKTMSLDRVHRLAKFYQLDAAATAELVAAWEELPISEYSAKQAKTYEQRKEFKNKAKMFDRMKVSLVEVCTMLVTSAIDPGTLCTCPEIDMFADESDRDDPLASCELCTALQLLGLTGFTDVDDTVLKLARVQEGLTG